MFLNQIKEIVTTKLIKNSLSNVNHSASEVLIKTVGIVFDENTFHEKEHLLAELQSNDINQDDCSIMVFRNKVKKKETFDYPIFTYNDINWNGSFSKPEVQQFINQPFDLLISFYDTEKAGLMRITHHSKANFKVGFSAVDKRLNHFMITTTQENYKVFIDELFKYLKILNKI